MARLAQLIGQGLEQRKQQTRLWAEDGTTLAALSVQEQASALLRTLTDLEDEIYKWKKIAGKAALADGMSARGLAQLARVSQDTSREWKKEL